MKGAAKLFAGLALGALLRTEAQELPPDSTSEIEPPILPGNLVPEKRAENQDIAQLERKLARAKQSAVAAERLCKIGVLSKLEAEHRALSVIKIQSDLAMAKATEADRVQTQLEQKQMTPDESSAAEAKLRAAKEAAAVASANLKTAELNAAELNLARRQKLLALGSGGKSMVRRAEEKLAQLKSEGDE